MLADYPRLNLDEDSINVADGYVTYLCYLGLAYKCANTGAISLNDDTPTCLYVEGNPDVMPDYWTPQEETLGRAEPTFVERFPDCQEVSDYQTEPTDDESEANLEFLKLESLTKAAETIKPLEESFNSALDAFELGEDTPLHVNRYGTLCISEVIHRENEASALFRQINDAVFDTSIVVNSETAEEDYPDNVSHAVQYITEELFDSIVENQSDAGFLTYWDFIGAIA
jgi:hypothetical protein